MNIIITTYTYNVENIAYLTIQRFDDDQFICAAKVDGEGETAILLVLFAFNPDQMRMNRFQP